MSEHTQPQETTSTESVAASSSPQIFISHDSRDAELAEAFSKLLKSVSAGMIKTFRSSDKTGGEGLEFGEEWYKRLMTQLQVTTDVVCLFTERSLDRPWILFEAGVAKGKLGTPVIGVALGVPLTRVSAGPFYQFMNMDDSDTDLSKLVHQLARRVNGLELDADVVRSQVALFKERELQIINKSSAGKLPAVSKEETEENAISKLVEAMKALPTRVAERVGSEPHRMKRNRRFHPGIFEEAVRISPDDPSGPIYLLMLGSLLSEDAPWAFQVAKDAYEAINSRNPARIGREISKVRKISDLARGKFGEMLIFSEESYFAANELPRIIDTYLRNAMDYAVATSAARPTVRRTPIIEEK